MKTAVIAALLLALIACPAAQEQQPSAAPNGRPVPDEVPYQVGGKVKPPKPVYTPNPNRPKHYPQGSVRLSCIIGTDGKVREAKVTRSLTPEADASALAVLQRWKFKPATKDDQPVAVQMNIEMGFR